MPFLGIELAVHLHRTFEKKLSRFLTDTWSHHFDGTMLPLLEPVNENHLLRFLRRPDPRSKRPVCPENVAPEFARLAIELTGGCYEDVMSWIKTAKSLGWPRTRDRLREEVAKRPPPGPQEEENDW